MVRQDFWRHGPTLIGVGVLWVVAAQLWADFPSITAIALVGRGAVLTLQSQPRTSRQDSLVVLNLTVYGILVCLAIAAQSNAVLLNSPSSVSLRMLLDHSLAIVVLLGLMVRVFSRLSQATAEP